MMTVLFVNWNGFHVFVIIFTLYVWKSGSISISSPKSDIAIFLTDVDFM